MKNVRNRQLNKGFTLAELLIVVAIIAVLVAFAIPVFSKQAEKSRESTDLANARAAYTALLVAAIEDKRDPELYQDGVYRMTLPLAQKKDDWTTVESKLVVAGLKQGDPFWLGRPKAGGSATVMVNPNTQQLSIDWQGGSGDPSFLSATAPYQYETLMELHASGTSAERKAADQETITAIGKKLLSAVKGMTKQQLVAEFGLFELNGGVRLADYYEHKDGDFNGEYWSTGVELVCTDGFLDILDQIGYVGVSKVDSVHDTYVHEENNNTYIKEDVCTSLFENSLFFSDQLAANQYQNYHIDETMRSILLTKVLTENNKVSQIEIQVKAMGGQANLTPNDKNDFTITIKLSDLDP